MFGTSHSNKRFGVSAFDDFVEDLHDCMVWTNVQRTANWLGSHTQNEVAITKSILRADIARRRRADWIALCGNSGSYCPVPLKRGGAYAFVQILVKGEQHLLTLNRCVVRGKCT